MSSPHTAEQTSATHTQVIGETTLMIFEWMEPWMEGLASEKKDFTVQFSIEQFHELLTLQGDLSKPFYQGGTHHLNTSIDGKIHIFFYRDNKLYRLIGRMNATSCYNGKAVSVTVREEHRDEFDRLKLTQLPINAQTVARLIQGAEAYGKANLSTREQSQKANSDQSADLNGIWQQLLDSGYAPKKNNFPTPKKGKPFYLYDFHHLIDAISDLIFPKDTEVPTGMVVVSGSTGCGKSNMVRALIATYLSQYAETKRKPHFVSIEDPIEVEARNFEPQGADNGWHKHPFDYTPRRLKLDCESIEQALLDCKRMTPAIVNIGETRRLEDWKALMEFAGSGHLIITTTHAGSTTETMERILRSVGAETPADRGYAAQSLLAVVHLESFFVSPPNLNIPATPLVPSIWRNLGGGGVGLVSDGLASILPHSSTSPLRKLPSLGRSAIAKKLIQQAKAADSTIYTDNRDYWDALLSKCAARDLKGM